MKREVQYINGKRVATPEYRSWQAMKNRCCNPRATDYSYYGGRGITVDPKWKAFGGFLEDMGRRPGAKHTLERTDGNKLYTKSNCVWATRLVQARNRAYCRLSLDKAEEIRRMYAAGGVSQDTLAKQYGVHQITISHVVRGLTWQHEEKGCEQ